MDFLALADSLISGFLYGILCRQQICVKRMASPVWETVLFFLVLVGTYQVMSLLNLPLASEPIAALSAFCYFHLICKSPVRNTAGMVLLLFLLHFHHRLNRSHIKAQPIFPISKISFSSSSFLFSSYLYNTFFIPT